MLEFKLSIEEANLIVSALSELPVKVSLKLIDKLQKQAETQLKPQKEQAIDALEDIKKEVIKPKKK